MPELPEVETVKNTLKNLVLNKKIIDVNILYANIIATPSMNEFIEQLKNETIRDISRRGKWLIFHLDQYHLLSHLRMEGKYLVRKPNDPYDKHEHVEFVFSDGSCLRYKDTRKFGKMYLFPKEETYLTKPLNELGLEPWDEKLTVTYLKEKLKNKKIPIKTSLLDQSIIVGIGNIYVDEILFLSHIHPSKASSSLQDKQLKNIIKHTKEVLEKAIQLGGTTIKTYESSEGVHGKFQNELLVHNNPGNCPTCHTKIEKIRIGGRGTYYCPICQKESS